MTTLIGEELTRWTIRLALAAYFGRLAVDLTTSGARCFAREQFARWLWTFGCLFLWLHVACAFQFHHHWSHDAAYEQTTRQTAAVTGLNWGGGIWVNYLLMLLWAGDVAWWWIALQSHRTRPILWEVLWQANFAFIVFNATVVFETGATRWIGLLAATALLALVGFRCRRPAA